VRRRWEEYHKISFYLAKCFVHSLLLHDLVFQLCHARCNVLTIKHARDCHKINSERSFYIGEDIRKRRKFFFVKKCKKNGCKETSLSSGLTRLRVFHWSHITRIARFHIRIIINLDNKLNKLNSNKFQKSVGQIL